MLKLVFCTKDRLKVRLATSEDNFEKSCKWKDRLEFIMSDESRFTMIWSSLLPDLEPEYALAFIDLVSARYPLSPDYPLLKSLCPGITFDHDFDEIVFFGGTFNPWHQGHQACLNLIPKDKTLLILPDRNPQKELRELEPVYTLLQISSRARLKDNQYLVPTFLLEQKKNPTVEWVEKLKNDFPTLNISLLMGFDSFSTLKTWIRTGDLLPKIHTIYVVSRLEDDGDRRLALDEAHALGPHLNVIFLGKHEYENISSTDIRKKQSL